MFFAHAREVLGEFILNDLAKISSQDREILTLG